LFPFPQPAPSQGAAGLQLSTEVLSGDNLNTNTFTNCTFTGNSAASGAGIYNFSKNLTIVNCIFSENSAASGGGGMYNTEASPTLTNCTFKKNSARRKGGGIYNSNSSPVLTDCTFSENSARYSGGGIYNNSGNPMIKNCSFDGNYARGGGGMENYEACPTLTNCTFTGNSAGPYGGGGGMYNYMESNPKLAYCKFIGNSAPWGGGVYNEWSNPTFTNCIFSSNSASAFGGGMNNSFLSSPGLTCCVFIDNSSDFCGGALSIHERSAPTMANCRIISNSAVEGGGMHIRYNSSPTLINCTFAANSATHGSALACNSFQQSFPSNLQVSNSILWNGDGDIWNNDWSTITVTYTDVQGGWPGTGNIDTDPCFISPGYWDANDFWVDGDYHLLKGSMCIDAGDPNYIEEPNETDLDGKLRVMGGRIDMGAYESPIFAEARILPQTINLASKGNWIICYIWLPDEYDVADIEPNSIFLEDEIKPDEFLVDEQQQVATARFGREVVQPILEAGDINLKITGRLTDGTVFEGADTIKVMHKADKN
jgi:predicted outer membrane repeat protein